MVIIDFETVMPGWFWTFLIIIGSIVALCLVLCIAYHAVTKDPSVWAVFAVISACVFILLVPTVAEAKDRRGPSPEEKERVASEVSEVVGFEVSVEEIDLMLDEKPVRDVYYIRDGNTLVVEEK